VHRRQGSFSLISGGKSKEGRSKRQSVLLVAFTTRMTDHGISLLKLKSLGAVMS